MKILAVRGENLASLADSFEVDFEAEPIAGTGLFVITGPTGAGKSTLLDAICLALYDKLPRMASADNAEIGRKDYEDQIFWIKAKDVRSILSHGAASGFAEVDFTGQDGKHYQARWEVNRARGKPDGKLQLQSLTLKRIDTGEIIGDKKTDTLDEIQKRIGLDFDQFRRAVLLAQNEFDAFIRAGDKERAELLERITGTDIYSKISIAVFARHREEKNALSELEARLGEHRPLSKEEREDIKRKVATAKSETKKLGKKRDALNVALGWYKTRDGLEKTVGDSGKNLEKATKVDADAEPERTTLNKVRKALGLRAEFEAVEKSQVKADTLAATLEARSEKENEAANNFETATEEEAKARKKSKGAERAFKTAGPELDKAGKLDTQIEEVDADCKEKKGVLATATAAFDEAQATLNGFRAAEKEAADEILENQEWLDENKTLKPIAERIDDIVFDITAYANVVVEISRSEQAAEAAYSEADTAENAYKTFFARGGELEKTIESQKKALQPILKQLKGKNLVALKDHQDNLNTIQNAIGSLEQAVKSAGKNSKRAQANAKRLDKAQKDQIDSTAVIEKLVSEIESAKLKREEAGRSYLLAEAAEGEEAEHLRAMLEPGEPCPVCGSTEHPAGAEESVFRKTFSAQKGRVAILGKEVDALTEQRAKALANKEAAETSIEDAGSDAETIATDKKECIGVWKDAVATIAKIAPDAGIKAPAFPDTPFADGAADPIDPFAAKLEGLIGELDQQVKELDSADRERNKLEAGIETNQGELRKVERKAGEYKTTHVRNEGVVKREQATITEKTRAKKAIGRRLKKLEGVFADWEDQTIEESENFTAQCRARTDEWEERAEVLVDAKQRSQSVAKEIKGTEGELGPLKKSRDQALNTYEKEAARFKTLKAERAKMFDGCPTGEVRSELNKNQVAAQKAHGEAQQWLSKANNAHSNSQTLAKEAQEQLASAKKEKEDSKKRLEKGCKKAGVKLEEVSEGLKIGDEWVEAEEKRLADIRGALAEAKVVRAERVKALEAHLKTNAPDEAREDLEGSHKKVSAALDAAADERAEVEGALRQDDEARNAIKNIESELTNRRKQAEVWARLNDLIGSHMGDKFRTFAQSLTLDWLVGLANERLKDLVPRFELERAAGGELAIQVIDHDMGDEVRGVHNLSGGEKFLVSLSLALALAGISSGQGIRVDSLFIDEGFGSLDNNCLNMAISALEALQATGRKVGVISHVDELKERIGVQVQVTPSGGGRSTVEVLAC